MLSNRIRIITSCRHGSRSHVQPKRIFNQTLNSVLSNLKILSTEFVSEWNCDYLINICLCRFNHVSKSDLENLPASIFPGFDL